SAGTVGRAAAADLIATHGFEAVALDPVPLPLAAWLRPARQGGVLNVYIEGDGNAWESRYRASTDPTPRDPLALRLAAADPSGAAVLYLGRPCQFATEPVPACTPALWTDARFSAPVIAALGAAVDQVKVAQGADELVVIGYSGGGVAAALLAAGRPDVRKLVTVAAPLDHAAWTAHHRVTPLTQSLTPMDRLAALAGIDQVHFAGGRDVVVPLAVVRRYVNAQAAPEVRLRVMEDYDHACCWAAAWPVLFGER
ncbi:MAG: alpha/beta hydrolase, partial [Pseudomonadota bacterium]